MMSRSIVGFGVTSVHSWKGNKTMQFTLDIEAVMLPKLTPQLPGCFVNLDPKWKHLHGLDLADPEFHMPGCIDVLLGTDIFSSMLLHGRWKGPRGTPVTLETHFGWVLMGSVCQEHT